MPEWLPPLLSFIIPVILAVIWVGRLDGRVKTLEAIEAERKGIIKDYHDHKISVGKLEERVRALEK